MTPPPSLQKLSGIISNGSIFGKPKRAVVGSDRRGHDPALRFWILVDQFVGESTVISCNNIVALFARNVIKTISTGVPFTFISTTFTTSLTTCYKNGFFESFLLCLISSTSTAGNIIQIIIVQLAGLGVQLGKVSSSLGGGHFHTGSLRQFQQLLSGLRGLGLFYQFGGGSVS